MIVHSNIGRVPRKIASMFVAFTADEWKNWTLIYSLCALHEFFQMSITDVGVSFKACRVLLETKLTR